MFPLLFTAQVRKFQPGATDVHGNPEESWAPATEHKVFGWSAPTSTEPKLAGHDRVTVDVELLAPEGFPSGPRDLVILNGTEFEAVGYPEDFNNGPFGFRPGLVVNLRRIEG